MVSSHLGSPFLSLFLAQDIPLPFVWPVGSSQFQQEGHTFPQQIRCNFIIHFSWITLIIWDTFNYFLKDLFQFWQLLFFFLFTCTYKHYNFSFLHHFLVFSKGWKICFICFLSLFIQHVFDGSFMYLIVQVQLYIYCVKIIWHMKL